MRYELYWEEAGEIKHFKSLHKHCFALVDELGLRGGVSGQMRILVKVAFLGEIREMESKHAKFKNEPIFVSQSFIRKKKTDKVANGVSKE